MKRIIAAGFVLLMVGLVGTPTYAIETTVTGSLTIDGILNVIDANDEDETMAYREMAAEFNTVTKINDKIKIMSQIEILDKVLNDPDSNVGTNQSLTVTTDPATDHVTSVTLNDDAEEDDNIQVEKLWMDIVTPVGLLSLGRMSVSTWGTTFYDDEDSGDRIKLVTPMTVGQGRLFLAAVAEKGKEYGHEGLSNRDNDKYYLTATYATKTYRAGLLLGYYPYGEFVAEDADAYADVSAAYAAFIAAPGAATGAALGGALAVYTPRVSADFMAIIPYYSGMVGPVKLNAEVAMLTGTIQLNPGPDAVAAITALGAPDPYGDVDIETLAYWIEVGYPMGSASVELGYYYMSGDDPTTADSLEQASYFGQGADWEKVFILTADDHGIGGNILETDSNMSLSGMSMFYLAGSFAINEKLSVNGLVAMATADEVQVSTYDDDYGMEIDLGLNWKIMDNLQYNAKVGYLMGGDWFEDSEGEEDLTITAMYHEVVLSF